ncbi:MAG TPA: hypothetical protein VFX97_10615 [Pyrinomonadaceae bacterium]|nr:hypothetical protein [Pyrinomonadaceae bacterium]
MRNIRLVPRALAAFVVAFLFIVAARVTTVPVTAEQKMKPEELVAKHLDSIGTAEARAAARNRIINGVSAMTLKQGGTGNLVGSALMASEGDKNLLMMAFERADYPLERIGYNGRKLSVKEVRPGVRTPLGEFFRTHDEMFREGLVGGTLSQSWPLLNVAERKPKLEYGGTKKIDGRLAHELKYTPNKGASLKMKLYFDAENFRHIRTEYERVIAATMGARPIDSSSRLDTRYKVIEEFLDFKEENGLTLPHTYKFELQISSGNAPLLLDWVISLQKFSFNQSMSGKEFDVEGG